MRQYCRLFYIGDVKEVKDNDFFMFRQDSLFGFGPFDDLLGAVI